MTTPPAAPRVRLRLHGVAELCLADAAPQSLERKHAALLAWLWLEGPTPRSRLAGLPWPEASEERARGNLRQRLLKLRQLAGDLVLDDNGVLALAPPAAVDPPDPAGAPLLQSLAYDDCEAFARWLEGRREAERERRKREWLVEVREAAQGQRLDDALYAADQLLQTDRESEEAYRVLMEVYYLRGDHAAALSAWDRCRDMLRQLYGVQPSAATQQLGRTLLEASHQSWAPTAGLARQLPPAVMRPPRLVGRAAAMRSLAAGWQSGHVLVVTGVSGVGKSRLLADWQAPLGAAAAAAARPGDAVLPYASLGRLLHVAVDRFMPALDTPHARQAARLLPRLAAAAGGAPDPVRTEFERTQALLALGHLMADCMAAGCAAFVLDDLQFADAASLAALRVLADPEGPPRPLRFAFGVRADEAGADAQALLQALAATRRCTRVDLGPLAAADAADLLGSLGVASLDGARWAPRLWQQVGGNPAFLLESVKLLLTDGEPEGDLPLPASIDDVIQRRIELLSPRARHLAQLAAIAGSAYSVPLAAAALACAPIELGEPLRELEQRQVFHGHGFVHDLIAGAAERSVPQAVAEFMHRFVAEHLEAQGGSAAHAGTHWQACAEWRRAGRAFLRAGREAAAAALANEQAALLDLAIAAFERDPAAHDELFSALEDRANAYESQGHEGLRPQFIARLQALARTEVQRLSALNHHNGRLVNLAQPVEEGQLAAGSPRALALGRPDLAWWLARTLAFHWAMNDRADDGLSLMQQHEAWIEAAAPAADRVSYRLTRSSIHAFCDRLPEAIAEGRLALQACLDAKDWPGALPAMSNVGLMHYWRGEYGAARALLQEGRELRERLYGSRGSGIKIDVHLGAVLYELGEADAARTMLEGAVAEILTWPDNDYRRTEQLLADNHLAQMHIALGHADEAAAVLAHDATGVADRFYGRRLALRLRWQRCFARVDEALRAELQALAARVASPFNRALMALELARHAPPDAALAECARWFDHPVAQQRPGLQLHAAAVAAWAAGRAGDAAQRARFTQAARDLHARCAPFDMTASQVQALLGTD